VANQWIEKAGIALVVYLNIMNIRESGLIVLDVIGDLETDATATVCSKYLEEV